MEVKPDNLHFSQMMLMVGRPHLGKHMHPVRKRIRFYSPSTYTRVYCFPGPAWVSTELAICLKPRWLQRNEASPLILLSQVVDLPPLPPASKKPNLAGGKDGVVTSSGSQFPEIRQQFVTMSLNHTSAHRGAPGSPAGLAPRVSSCA